MGSGGDLAELRGLLVVVSFLSVTVLLVTMLPGDFLIPASANRAITVPTSFSSGDLLAVAASTNYTNIGHGFDEEFDLGGYHFALFTPLDDSRIIMWHAWTDWWIFDHQHPMQWYDSQNAKVSTGVGFSEGIPLGAIDSHGLSEIYEVQCSHTFLKVMFAYNQTLYSTVQQAYGNHTLEIWLGINFDQVNTTYNAWNIMAMLLFFQMPDVNPVINAIIATPCWICIAYLIYTLLTKLIPFT